MQRVDDDAYRFALGLATMQLAIQLTDRETDERRHTRKVAVVTEKWEALRSAFPAELDDLRGYGGTGPSVRQLADAFGAATDAWDLAQRHLLLIDVLMGDPFAPYELKVSVDDAVDATRELTEAMGLDPDALDTVWQVWSDALMAYRPSRWRRPRTKVKQIPALAADGFVLPPSADESDDVGGAADDGVDALTRSGRHAALLSGGSLSGAEPERAGGLWLATIDQDAGSAADNDRVRRLLRMPLAQARTELVKLAMAHALVVRPGHVTSITTTTVLGALGQLHIAVDDQLEAEEARNDEDAPRIRTLEEVLRAIDVARTHVEQVRDVDEAREASERAALEATGDLPPIAGSPEPPPELAPPVAPGESPSTSWAVPPPAAPDVVPTPGEQSDPAAIGGRPWAEAGDAAAGGASIEQSASTGPTPGPEPVDPTTPGRLPVGALDGELVVDFIDDTSPSTAPVPDVAHRSHASATSLVAAAVADVMAMGRYDVAATPIDESEPQPTTVSDAIDEDAPNPLRAPVAVRDLPRHDRAPAAGRPEAPDDQRARGAA